MEDDEIPTLVPVQVDRRVPLTIITGFLGAGKSTLLKRILTERHGYRIAVIMNEFGDTADIESRTINVSSESAPEGSEEILELANGCLCCSIKDSGAASIELLMKRKGAFDYILLETTGLADPGPIASIFWQNEDYAQGLGRDIYLDGVVGVVDAVFGEKQMAEDHAVSGMGESLRQIAASDVILLNKVDLAPPAQVDAVEATIRQVNPLADVHRTVRASVELAAIIGISAYGTHRRAEHVHGPDCDHAHDGRTHYEVRGISSLQVPCPVLDAGRLEALDAWIRALLWEGRLPDDGASAGIEVLRCKGLVYTASGAYVLQGVRNLYELEKAEDDGALPDISGAKPGKLVFIGKGLNDAVRADLERRLA